jgi:hypothetical protein
VKLTYAPMKDWRVSAAYRFGKTNGQSRGEGLEHVAGGTTHFNVFGDSIIYYAHPGNHLRVGVHDSEEHALADFTVGREVGFGAFGEGGRSHLGLGIGYAKLTSISHVTMDGLPDGYVTPSVPLNTSLSGHRHHFTTKLDSERGFEGMGPTLTWEASARLFGDDERGHADLDWSVGGGVLFGKQTTDSSEDRWGRYYNGSLNGGTFVAMPSTSVYDDVVLRSRTEDVTVPNVSLSLGLSYAIDRVKVSTGYSYDRFFDAIDGGYTESQTFDRTIHGPYLKLSLGFGG